MRETNAKAWDAANDLISRLDDETIASAQKVFARMDSVRVGGDGVPLPATSRS